MDAESNKQVVAEVVCNVLEQMAFMFGDPMELDEISEADGEGVLARMQFKGPFTGSMTLAAPEELCPMLAENMLGVEPDDDRAQEKAHDALKELLNVCCGNVLTSLAGEEPVFDLTVPEVRSLDAGEWQAIVEDERNVGLSVDDCPVMVRLEIE